jgi:DNA-binding LacI/PurR family transcriptional regulator
MSSPSRKKNARFVPSNQIKLQLMRYILDGRYEPGQSLPTIQILSETLKVSTKTVQKAIHALSAEGLIEARRGVGLRVKAIPVQAGRKREIGLIHPHISADYHRQEPYPGEVIRALQKGLKKEDYTLVPLPLATTDPLTIVETVTERRWSGAVLFEIDSDPLILELREARVPMISMDYDASRHGISSVIFDNIRGTFQATRLLIQQGHRDIAFLRPLLKNPFIGRHSYDWVETVRLEGYRLAMLDAGLPIVCRDYPNSGEAQKAVLLDLFARRPSPTACVCVADWSACTIAGILMGMGYRIPDDVSITGFGDSEAEFKPGSRLTSVHLEYAQMGAVGAELMLEAMSGTQPLRREVLPTSIADHDSVARHQTAAV